VIKPGRILYEMEGVSDEIARKAMRLAQHKLGLHTEIIHRSQQAV
jgi:large subunit ribosomal protein L16